MAPTDWRRLTVVAYLDEPPFFSPVDGGQPIGCDIELTNTVLGELGVGQIEFVLTTFAELIPGLLDGRWHVNTPMYITSERAQLVDFSLPVWAASDSFVVRASDRRDFSSYEAIASDDTIRLAVVTGQVQHQTALTAGVPVERIIEFADQEATLHAVVDGHADAAVSTTPGNAAFLRRLDDARLIAVTDVPAGAHRSAALGAFTFPKSSTELSSAFDRVLLQYLGTSPHLEMMRRHGFTETDLRPALTAAGLDR